MGELMYVWRNEGVEVRTELGTRHPDEPASPTSLAQVQSLYVQLVLFAKDSTP